MPWCERASADDQNSVWGGDGKGLTKLRNYPIKPYIPRIWRDFLDLLALERHANKFRSQPAPTISQVGKTAIVVSASHADAIALIIESDRRRNDNIEAPGIDHEAANGFPNTEKILFELGLGIDLAKHHLRLAAQNRHKSALVCAPGGGNDFVGIDFIAHWQEARERLAGVVLGQFANASADSCRCPRSCFGPHAAASM